jgi:hypothetical protein
MRIARIAAVAVLAPIVLGAGPGSSAAADQASVEVSHVSSAWLVGSSGPDEGTASSSPDEPIGAALAPAERVLVQSVIDGFTLVGLELPDVDVHFYDDKGPCDGHEGIFRGDHVTPRLHICVADRGTAASDLWRRRTLIHEFAHAWDHANLQDKDRSGLLAMLEAERWFSNESAWADRGGERFAETIVWGLYDQLRRPVKIDVSCRELNADFQHITGQAPLGPVREGCMWATSKQSIDRP